MIRPTHTEPRGPLTMALSLRDAYTQEHSGRVEALCVALARACGIDEEDIPTLRDAARLHDIGKIGIPDGILLKPGRLDPGEWEIMRSHSVAGAQICERMERPDAGELARLVRHHHEWFDGSGYPEGLAGEDIPLGARIIGVVDSYDAMSTRRAYQAPRSHAEIIEIMRGERGRKSDPAVFDRFVALLEEHAWKEAPGPGE